MNKDWNYALMWDTIRRSLEESAIQGLEFTALNVLNGMIMLEELEEQRRKEREELEERHQKEREEREWCRQEREMQTMFDVKTMPLKEVEKMAKFIEFEDGRWLNADKIELMFTEVNAWRRENKAYIRCSIQAITSSGKRYTLLGITRSVVIPDEKKRKFDKDLEETVNSKLNEIAKWIATLSDNSSQTTVAASDDMFTDIVRAMDAVVNNIQAEEAEECE